MIIDHPKIIFAAALLLASGARAQVAQRFQDARLPEDERISDLLSHLTLEQKIDLFGKGLNLPALGIHGSGSVPSPVGTNGQFEGLHGVTVAGPGKWGAKSPGTVEHGGSNLIATTQFPQAAGLGETWDPALLERVGTVEGYEARYVFQTFDRGGLILRAPNADLVRDPRWGRSEESYGEDPFLVGTLATAYTRGLQGHDPTHWLTASMLKHFMANSNEDNRRGSSSNFDQRLLHEYYAAPFRMAIEQGHADSIMAAYNAVNGTPMTASPLLHSLLSERWGFNGLIDSDRGAVTYMVENHHAFPDLEHAVAAAVHAGINQFLNPYDDAMRKGLADHLITEQDLDANLRGLLRVMLRLGFLDAQPNPYTAIRAGSVSVPWDRQETKDLVLQATRESIVLLKNAAAQGGKPLLPLDPASVKTVAVFGPLADVVKEDFYGGTPPFAVTPLAGMRERAHGRFDIRTSADPIQALQLARTSDVAVLVLGSDPTCSAPFGKCPDPTMGKEAVDRKQISLNAAQQKLIEDTFAANPRTVLVLVTGYPYAIQWEQEHVPSIVTLTHSSEEQGTALAEVLFGDYNPAGRLTVTWPTSLEQLPPMIDYNLRDGRTYMYIHQKPLYAFGHGLSYTTFRYSDMRLSDSSRTSGGAVTASVKISNSGTRAGDEVVQMYVRHQKSAVSWPQRELKGFTRIHLAAGESRRVELPLAASALAYWNENTQAWTVEPDHVIVEFGSASDDIQASRDLEISAR
jgi:beta-glucosidase